MHILLAEDDKVSREVLRRIVESEPEYTLTQVCDGAEAWEVVRDPSRGIDACILDICMPNLSGLEVVERIRGDESTRHTPVILCTAICDRETVERAARLSITQYIVKPYSRSAVLDKLLQIRSELPRREVLEKPESVCQRLGIEPDMRQAMLETLLDEVRAWIDLLRAPLAPADAQRLFIRGRGFKGSCLSLGARRTARQFGAIEAVIQGYLAQSGGSAEPLQPAALAALLEHLEREIRLVVDQVKAPAAASAA